MEKKKWRLMTTICLCLVLVIGNAGIYSDAVIQGDGDSSYSESDDSSGDGTEQPEDTGQVLPDEEEEEEAEDIGGTEQDDGQELADTEPDDQADEVPEAAITGAGQVSAEVETESLVQPVASIGDANDFINAFTGLSNNAVVDIMLTGNITINSVISISANNVTVNISGKRTVTVIPDYLFEITGNNTTMNLNEVTISGGGIRINSSGRSFTLNGSGEPIIQQAGAAIDAASKLSSTSPAYITVKDMKFINNHGVTFDVVHNFGTNAGTTTEERHGGAIAIHQGRLDISGSTFSDNKVQFAGGAIYSGDAELTIRESLFHMNQGTVGGAIYSDSGSVSIDGGTFTSNRGTDKESKDPWLTMGGAVLSATGNITIDNSKFEDNIVVRSSNQNTRRESYGGAIRSDSGTIKVSNSSILRSKATWGGAIYNKTGTTILTECTMKNNETDSRTGTSACGGGAVYSYQGSVAINKGEYSGNRVIGGSGEFTGGGVVQVESGAIEISGGSFTGNSSSVYGGAVYALQADDSQNILTITEGAVFSNNIAEENGGAVHSYGKTNIDRSSFINNGAAAGGAIYLSGMTSPLTLSSSTLDQNYASENGGGIFAEESDVSLTTGTVISASMALAGAGAYIGSGTITVADEKTEIHDNTATGEGSTGGAGIYVDSGEAVISDGSIYKNTTKGSGGGIGANTGNITLDGGSIYANTANGNGGGGIAVYSGKLTMNGGTVGGSEGYANKALQTGDLMGSGGGIYIVYGAIEVTGGTISYNEARNGGGIYFNGQQDNNNSVFNLSGVTVTGNNAVARGGGIFVYLRNEDDAMDEVILTHNRSGEHGGGIFLQNVEGLKVKNPWNDNTISDNYSERGAGVTAMGSGSLVLQGGEVCRNQASVGGAGIYAYLNLTLRGIQINTNKALGTHGGGIVANGTASHVTIEGGTVNGNIANEHGGGIYIFERGKVTVNNSASISNNDAGYHGGGIYLSTGTLDIKGKSNAFNLIQENNALAGSGGGMYVRNGTLDLAYTQIMDNNAAINGGGFYLVVADQENSFADPQSILAGKAGLLSGMDELTRLRVLAAVQAVSGNGEGAIQSIEYNEITGNTAGQTGGGAYVHINTNGVSNSIVGNTLAGNNAYDGGGAYVNYEGDGKRISENQFYNNEAEHNGGGLYLTGKGETRPGNTSNRMALTNDEIYSNTAGNNGGGIYLTDTDILLFNAYDRYGAGFEAIDRGPDISGNKALNGGGIYITSGSSVEIWRMTTIDGNEAEELGGGIFIEPSSTLTFQNTDQYYSKYNDTENEKAWIYITGNKAQHGGGIYGLGTGLQIANAVITANTASTADQSGNGGGIWLMHTRLADLDINNVQFVHGAYEKNKADRGYKILDEDIDTYKDKIHTDSTFSHVDTTNPNYPHANAYNNFDIAYNSESHIILFNANGGVIIDANGTDTGKDTQNNYYTSGKEIPEDAVPTASYGETAAFIGWFESEGINPSLLNSRTSDLSSYSSAKVDNKDIIGTQVYQDYTYIAGWLYAPVVDDVYDSEVYGAGTKVTGTGNPGATVTVEIGIGDGNYISDTGTVNSEGKWEIDFPGSTFIKGNEINATQSYPDAYPGVTSPKAAAKILEGYQLVYRSGYDGNTKVITHTVTDGREYSRFMASQTLELYGGSTYTREGFNLQGWALENDSSEVTYAFKHNLVIQRFVDNELVINNTITLYGVWQEVYYKVTYDKGIIDEEVTVPVDSGRYGQGGVATIRRLEKTQYGEYYFAGWRLYFGEQGTDTIYQYNSTHTFSGDHARDITLVAQWEFTPSVKAEKRVTPAGKVQPGELLDYQITAVNSGKGTWVNGSMTDTLPPEVRVIDDDGIAVEIDGQPVTDCQQQIEYLESSARYRVTVSGLKLASGETVDITIPVMVRTTVEPGTVFFNTAAVTGEDGGGNRYTEDKESEENVVAGFVVNYHSGIDGVGGQPSDDRVYRYGEEVAVLDSGNMDYEGHYFAGWSTSPDYAEDSQSGEFYEPGDTFDIKEDTDLYAVFYKEKPPVVQKSVDQTQIQVGGQLAYTITVTNPGRGTWSGSLADILQEGLEYQSWKLVKGDSATLLEAEGRITIYISDLQPGAEVIVEITVTAQKAGVYHNTVTGIFEDEDGKETELTDSAEEVKVDEPTIIPPVPEPPQVQKTPPPVIDDIYEGDKKVEGDGIPGAEVIVTFPDGTEVSTTVDESGRWSVPVPDHIHLKRGEILSAIQIEPGKLASDVTREPVKPRFKRAIRNAATGDAARSIVYLVMLMVAVGLFVSLWIDGKRHRK